VYGITSSGQHITLPFPAFCSLGLPSQTCWPASSYASSCWCRRTEFSVICPILNSLVSYHAANRSAMSAGSKPCCVTKFEGMGSACSASSVIVFAGWGISSTCGVHKLPPETDGRHVAPRSINQQHCWVRCVCWLTFYCCELQQCDITAYWSCSSYGAAESSKMLTLRRASGPYMFYSR